MNNREKNIKNCKYSIFCLAHYELLVKIGPNDLKTAGQIVLFGQEGFKYRNHEIQNKFIHFNHIFY